MNTLRRLGRLAVTSMALLLIAGGACASASELYKYTSPGPSDTLGVGTPIKVSMLAGWSMHSEETSGWATDTCTAWAMEGTLKSAGGEASHPIVGLSSSNISGCVNATKFLKPGELEIRYVGSGTEGDLYLKNAEMTYVDTTLGIDCIVKIETATQIGRLTGAKSGSATLYLGWWLPEVGLCSDKRVVGTLSVTSPTGLIVEAK
jgi:hypothetical protein